MAMPALDLQKASFTFTDGLENSAVNSHYVPLGTAYADLSDLYDKLQACSNCAMERVSLSFAGTDPTAVGTNAAAYVTAADRADLIFQASDNSSVPFSVFGPKDALFQSDKKTINPVQADVAALIVQILALIITKGGKILVEYLRGKREEGKPKATKAGVVLHTP